MIQLNNITAKIKGQQINTITLFIEPVYMINGKDIKLILYPYLSVEARKDNPSLNHFRHEIKYFGKRKKTIAKSISILKGETVLMGDTLQTKASVIINNEVNEIPENTIVQKSFITENDCNVLRGVQVVISEFMELEDIIINTTGHIQENFTFSDFKNKVCDLLINLGIVDPNNILEV